MGSAKRIARRIAASAGETIGFGDRARKRTTRAAAESEGARREREEHELEQQWGQPPVERGAETAQDLSQDRFDGAMDAASSLLKSGPPGLGKVLHRADDNSGGPNDIREIAAFCRAVAGEMAAGAMKDYFTRLGAAMVEYAEAWESNPA